MVAVEHVLITLAATHAAIGIDRAHATLRQAARFLGNPEAALAGRFGYPSKVLGNGLRELDRFLSVLIDEVAAQAELDDEALARLRSRRNTANKLRMLRATLGHDSPDHRRLRALGRSRDCFFYCGGRVRRADTRTGSLMTAGWPARLGGRTARLAVMPLGSRLDIDHSDIDDICRFYGRIADDLLQASRSASLRPAERSRHPVAFSRE